MAVRIAIEYHIAALPRTPFPASRDFPSRGNEKIGGTGYCVTYDIESQSRNAGFISIALRAIRNPRGQRPRQTYEPLGRRPSHLKNLSLHNPSTQPAAEPRPFFIKLAAKPPPQPSARRAVKLKNPPAVRPVNPKNPRAEGASRVPCAILSGLLYN